MDPIFGGSFGASLAQLSIFYYGVAFVLHSVVPTLVPIQSIQKEPRASGDVRRDALSSLPPLVVKAGIWVMVEKLHSAGYGRMYDEMPRTPWGIAYAILTIALLDYLHDAWFYWTHRALHWRPLYKHIHYMHHQSSSPSAYTGYSFHVLEAVIVFANEIFVIFMFPIHTGLHRLYHLFTTAIHNGGHAGYELAPFIPSLEQLVWVALHGTGNLCKGLNTVQHHDMHHRYPTKHFSLYFTHWDRWFGTLHSKYDTIVHGS
mmetsp:Transcript_22175/g.61531  ORF Transcript_22175/g.61531 Transcript_22175/m.61531 type:complete len:259 (+) Transcript_22175:255-1031(+)